MNLSERRSFGQHGLVCGTEAETQLAMREGCRSPCPWYLRDSRQPAVGRLLLRCATHGGVAALQTAVEKGSKGPERVWEFAPSVGWVSALLRFHSR